MSAVRITIGQIRPTTGDITANIALMEQVAQTGRAEKADLVVFPELSLTGSLSADLFLEPQFIERIEQGLERLRQVTQAFPDLYWVIGAPTRRQGPGKMLENSLLVFHRGREVLKYAKKSLATCDSFDEPRYFASGTDNAAILEIAGTKIGFLIGRDTENCTEESHATTPLRLLAEAGVDLAVAIDACPSYAGRNEQRLAQCHAVSRRHRLPLLYVNQIGGYAPLVFDGGSFAVTPESGTVFLSRRFEPATDTLSFDKSTGFAVSSAMPRSENLGQPLPQMEFYLQQIVLGLRDYARDNGFRQVVVGSSGGIDSALVLALATEALGPDNVVGITMPSPFSSAGSISDSEILCRNLGIQLFNHPIHDILQHYESGFSKSFAEPLQGLAKENLQARIRGTILMEYSNRFGHLLLTTGNKSEIAVGYCTLYGDTNGGLGLIGDLYKTEVFALSRHLNKAAGRELIPSGIIDKEPSAELAPNQRDTDSLPPYPVLDTLLKVLIEGECLMDDEKLRVEHDFALLTASEEGQRLVRRIRHMIARNEYKRHQMPPTIRLRGRAFGRGRRMPISTAHD